MPLCTRAGDQINRSICGLPSSVIAPGGLGSIHVFSPIFQARSGFRGAPERRFMDFWWDCRNSLCSSLEQQHTPSQLNNTRGACISFLTPGCNISASSQILTLFPPQNQENHLSAIKKTHLYCFFFKSKYISPGISILAVCVIGGALASKTHYSVNELDGGILVRHSSRHSNS